MELLLIIQFKLIFKLVVTYYASSVYWRDRMQQSVLGAVFFVLCHFWRVFTSWTVSSRVIRVKVNLCIFKGWMYFNPKPSELYLDQINAKRKTYFCNATLVFDRLIFYRDSCDDTMSCRILTKCVCIQWGNAFCMEKLLFYD